MGAGWEGAKKSQDTTTPQLAPYQVRLGKFGLMFTSFVATQRAETPKPLQTVGEGFMHRFTRRSFGVMLAASTASSSALAASAPDTASDKPVLTVTGLVSAPDKKVTFTMAQLEGLGIDGFETRTPWYDGPVRFDGVRMTKLMDAVGATGVTVTATALNDYITDLPISDFKTYGVILATKRNGAYMPVRDKGPLFIVYPYDSAPELKAQRYYSRSAWQVASLLIS